MEIKPVNPKGSQPWIFIGRSDAQILWPLDVKSRLPGKDPDSGENWGQEEKGATEDEMVAWHHWFNGLEFEQTPGDSDGQRSLAFMGLQSDMTYQLNNNNNEYSKSHTTMATNSVWHKYMPSLYSSSLFNKYLSCACVYISILKWKRMSQWKKNGWSCTSQKNSHPNSP